MLTFGNTKVTKALWCKKTINIWNVNVNNIVISKRVESKLIVHISLDIEIKS